MSVRSVVDRLEATGTIEKWLTTPYDPTPRQPDRDIIAFFVAWCRATKQLSIEALACMANVSVSSIERIERSEHVSYMVLKKVAVALDQAEDAFTAVRSPLRLEEALSNLESGLAAFDGTIEVPVSQFTKQNQVRELSRCHVITVDGSRLDDDAQPAVEALREWLGFVNFERMLLESDVIDGPKSPIQMRKLNEDVLTAVQDVKKVGRATGLTGCYDAELTYTYYGNVSPKPKIMPIRVGLVAFFPRMTDPCASKRQFLYGPKRIPFQPENF